MEVFLDKILPFISRNKLINLKNNRMAFSETKRQTVNISAKRESTIDQIHLYKIKIKSREEQIGLEEPLKG